MVLLWAKQAHIIWSKVNRRGEEGKEISNRINIENLYSYGGRWSPARLFFSVSVPPLQNQVRKKNSESVQQYSTYSCTCWEKASAQNFVPVMVPFEIHESLIVMQACMYCMPTGSCFAESSQFFWRCIKSPTRQKPANNLSIHAQELAPLKACVHWTPILLISQQVERHFSSLFHQLEELIILTGQPLSHLKLHSC